MTENMTPLTSSSSSYKTQYDTFASRYASMEDLPSEIVATNLLRNTAARGPRSLKVLDLGCGTGTYARLLIETGVAEHVVGVDVSSEMVRVGQAMEAERPGPARIEFHVADCAAPLDHLGLQPAAFDLVMGNWVLNYASDRAELAGMWRNIATYLKPGGKFIGLKENVDSEDRFKRDNKYGIEFTVVEESGEGLKVHVVAHTEPKIEFDAYSLEPRLYEEVPLEVGMTEVIHLKPSADDLPDGGGENMGFWKGFLDDPYFVLATTVKAE
jgi:SAM-dependent methyltransferase